MSLQTLFLSSSRLHLLIMSLGTLQDHFFLLMMNIFHTESSLCDRLDVYTRMKQGRLYESRDGENIFNFRYFFYVIFSLAERDEKNRKISFSRF